MLSKFFSSSRVKEIQSSTELIVKRFNERTLSDDVFLNTVINNLTANNALLAESINKGKTASALEEKDAVRDPYIRQLGYMITGYVYNPPDEIRSSAGEVNEIFSRFGISIVHESYKSESGAINSLLKDLEAEKV